jgi:uncharacterized membrane protein
VLSRLDAQQRADAIRVFQEELSRLERDGALTLSDDQRRSLGDHHRALLAEYAHAFDIDRDAGAKRLSLAMRIASLLGALALSASVFFLFQQFWGRLATPSQVTILIAGSLAALVATLRIHTRDPSGYFTNLAAMVTFACFVLNITMLGRIFSITPSDAALVSWAALAFLLAYTCDLRLLLAAGIVCATVYVASRIGTFAGAPWPVFGERPENFIGAGLVLFAIPQIIHHQRFPGFASLYRWLGLVAVFVPLFILSVAGSQSYVTLSNEAVERLYQALGFVACAGALWTGLRRDWRETVNVGVIFFVIFLYARFFDWWWDVIPKYLFFLVLGVTAVAVLLALRRARAAGFHVLGSAST